MSGNAIGGGEATERCERRFELAAESGLKSSVTNGEGRDFL